MPLKDKDPNNAYEYFHNNTGKKDDKTRLVEYEVNWIPRKDLPKGVKNGIWQGNELVLRVKNAEIVSGRIAKNNKLLLIDQSTDHDEDNNVETINFDLRKVEKGELKNFEEGEYDLIVWWFDMDTKKGGHYHEKFNIIRKV